MAKLSEQVTTTSRPTRTQRVQSQQEAIKQRRMNVLLEKEVKQKQQELEASQSLEEYEQKYNLLDPRLKSYFTSPEELRQQRTEKAQENKQKVVKKIEDTRTKLQSLESDYNKKREEYNRIRDSKSRGQALDDLAKSYDERKTYYEGVIDGLNRGLGELENNQYIEYGDILSYAEQYGDIRVQKLTARREERVELRKREESIEELLKKGYKPQLIREYQGKQLEGAKITFYNPDTKQFALVKPIKVKTTQIAGLKESDIKQGKFKVPVDIEGKKFEFSVGQKIYVGKDDQLITGLGALGITQTEAKAKIDAEYKKQIDQAYKETIKQERVFLDYTPVDTSKFGYKTRGTISDQPQVDYTPIKVKQAPKESSIIKGVSAGLKNVLAKTGQLKLNIFVGAGGTITTKELKEGALGSVSESYEKIYQEDVLKRGFKEPLDKKFEEEYSIRFYRSEVGKKAFYGEIPIEEAEKTFAESDVAKVIGQRYQEEYKKASAGKWSKAGVKLAGLTLAKSGIELIPETYGGLALESTAFAVGIKTLKVIPRKVLNVATAGIGTVGTYQALSPLTTPEEKASGAITAIISFGALAGAGIGRLRSPTVKSENIIIKETIRNPKLSRGYLDKTSVRVVKNIAGKTTIYETYKGQQTVEKLVYGRRTIVSTKLRDLLRLKPIYEGIPYQQRGSKYVLQGLRGTTIYQTDSAYQKALKLLTKRGGYTPTQAKETLRYYQPKRIIYDYEADILATYSEMQPKPIIKIEGRQVITQPVEVISKELGIRTRGAKTIKELISGTGEVVGEVKGRILYKTGFDITKTYVTKEGAIYQNIKDAGKTTKKIQQIVSVAEKPDEIIKLQYGPVSRDFPIKVFEEKTLAKQLLPRGRVSYGESESALLKREPVKIEVDERMLYGISVEKEVTAPKRIISDISKLKDKDYIKKFLKSLERVYGKEEAKQIITPSRTPPISTQTIIGTGQEATVKTSIKTTFRPITNVTNKIKSILKIKSLIRSSTAVRSASAVASASAVSQRSTQNQVQNIKSVLKSAGVSKSQTGLREEVLLRSLQSPASASRQLQRELQVPKLKQGLLSIEAPITRSFGVPDFRIPRPKIPPFYIYFPPARLGGKKGRFTTRQFQQELYLPDFTARALGLNPKELSQTEAKAQIKKILTGLEIRRGIKLR